MHQPHWKDVWRYRFDNFMARGGSSIFLSLVVMFIAAWAVLSLVRALVYGLMPTGSDAKGLFGQFWFVFLNLTDPGTMALDVPARSPYKIVAILSGFTGVIIFSMLIAFITTTLAEKMSYLRKGHSRVLEKGHTLILGWNERVVEILRELIMANESESHASVVILSERDKEWMDDFLDVNLAESGTTRIVTRSGNTASPAQLERVATSECKSVIVLASCRDMDGDELKALSDAKAIKTILALRTIEPLGEPFGVVAEVFSARNRRIIKELTQGEVIAIDTSEILAKILVQTSRSGGLSVVYSELLSFDGCELYFYNDKRWGEMVFGDLQFHFPDGVPIGIRRVDGELLINPAVGTTIGGDDDILIVAEDNSTIEFRPQPVASSRDLPLKAGRLEHTKERNLILGWNPKAPLIIREYEDYVLEDSDIVVMVKEATAAVRAEIYALQNTLTQINLYFIEEDPAKIESLLEVKPFTFDNIIILSQSGTGIDGEKSDSDTIILLLLLREIFAQHADEAKQTKLITEVMESDNQDLVSRVGVDDFIISNRLVSMIFAQISEEHDMKRVYDDLFSEDGSEIYLKPASLYFDE
ncbi:MAG: hypothetical protein KC609_16820, partial [Myxococcales bacterium]|nr:hypothetical protein [Myxococcales bacterium]